MIVMNGTFLAASSLVVFLVLLTFTSHVPIYNTAYACSCMIPESPRDSLQKSDAVFSGKVVEIKEENPSYPLISSMDPVWVSFEVDKVWKGPRDPITIQTPQSSASCGYSFEKGESYLVYAYQNGNTLEVSLCSRTTLVSNAAEDLEELGKPKYNKDTQEFSHSETILPPLKQIQGGISLEDILCTNDKVLIYKNNNDNTPACVKPSSVDKLIERGWVDESKTIILS